jgi:YegS/Rv2252/BmrU family lipid kinase
VDYEIHTTSAQGEATEFVRAYCEQHPDTYLRFYACGGDGTVSETVNGAHGFANASVGIVPVGTGNDFVRNFQGNDAFLDIAAQLDGETHSLDLIKFNDKLCTNMINVGFYCEVVKQVAKIKRSKLIPKNMAYVAGLVITLIRKPGVRAKVSLDGSEPESRDMLLTAVANGEWCGGGFHSTPLALLQDGMLDTLLIKNVSRTRFLTLVSLYKNGTFVGHPRAQGIIEYVKCHTVQYFFEAPQSICVDGEVSEVKELCVSCVRNALSLVVPKGSAYKPERDVLPTGTY